jgi:hypothetical protein
MKFTKANIEKLKALNLPFCTAEDIGIHLVDGLPEELKRAEAFIAKLNESLKEFLPPGPCVLCKRDLNDTFRWGLAHGEGFCSVCNYPTRLYHFVKDDTGEESRIVRPLQYHPSGFSLNEKFL